MNNNCLEILGLNYKNIFKDFSIAFADKSFLAITGPNNCGKTTLIRIIDGTLKTTNTILLYGKKLEDYKITEVNNIIQTVIPLEITFTQVTVEEELIYKLPLGLNIDLKQKILKKILKQFKLTKIKSKNLIELSVEETIKLQLALATIVPPKILLLDDLSTYFSRKDLLELLDILNKIRIESKITIIMATINLNITINTDYIYVLNNSEIVLEGEPLSVLEKDNILNKVGLELPFMLDLSVKLRDYDLLKKTELDIDRMVDTLWN